MKLLMTQRLTRRTPPQVTSWQDISGSSLVTDQPRRFFGNLVTDQVLSCANVEQGTILKLSGGKP